MRISDWSSDVCSSDLKVSKADLRGDGKWPDYLDYCDRFFWAVPQGFDLSPFDEPGFRPDIAGLLVADRYDASEVRDASHRPLPLAPRRSDAPSVGEACAITGCVRWWQDHSKKN